jgi:hypothetical protein
MWRRVREAARRGRRHASNALSAVGRAAIKVGTWLGHGALNAGILLGKGVRFLARGITWTWMTVVEIYCLTEAPFTWVIFNVVFFVARCVETLVNKLRGTKYTTVHDIFPAFSLQNAWAFDMVTFYPLVVLVGWILSPLTGRAWFRQTMAQYKMRAIDLGDWAYQGRFRSDLNPTVREDKDVWAESTGFQPGRRTAEEEADFREASGFVRVYPDPNVGGTSFQYLMDRVTALMGEDAQFRIEIDDHNQYWVLPEEGMEQLDLTPPARWTGPDPRHAASERMEEPPVAPEEGEPNDWTRVDADVPDYNTVQDPRTRSWLYGRQVVLTSIEEMPNFLDDVELQNKQRALVYNDTKNPETGFLAQHAKAGFDEVLEALKKAAHPV